MKSLTNLTHYILQKTSTRDSREDNEEELELHPSKKDTDFLRDRHRKSIKKIRKRRKRSPTPSSSSETTTTSYSESETDNSEPSNSEPTASTSSARGKDRTKEQDISRPKRQESNSTTDQRQTKDKALEDVIKQTIQDYFKNDKKTNHDLCCNTNSRTVICRLYNNVYPNKPCERTTSHAEPRTNNRNKDTVEYNIYIHACSTCFNIRGILDHHKATCQNCPVKEAWRAAREAGKKKMTT